MIQIITQAWESMAKSKAACLSNSDMNRNDWPTERQRLKAICQGHCLGESGIQEGGWTT